MTAPLDASEQTDSRIAELEAQLRDARSEIAQLRKPRDTEPRWSLRFRKFGAAFLIALCSLLSVIALLSVWLSNSILNTDQYVKTVEPLATNPAVQATVAERATDQLFANVDVEARVRAALPPEGQALAPPLTSQIEEFVEGRLVDVMSTPAFAAVWEQANRVTQEQVSDLLLERNDGRVLQSDDGVVSLDLNALVTRVLAELQASGVTLFDGLPADKVQGSVVLLESDEVAKASDAARTLHAARYVAPVLLLLSIAGALWLSTDRRKATAWLGVSVAVGMLAVVGMIAAGRDVVLDQATDVGLPRETAGELFDTLIRFLQRSNAIVLTLAVVTTLAALLTGPGRLAATSRNGVRAGASKIASALQSQGWQTERASLWIDKHLATVRGGVIAAAALLLWWWVNPTVLVLVMIIGVTLLVLFAIEVVRSTGSSAVSASGA